MRRERLYVTLSVCLTIVIASTWFARAGSIAPPPGPVGGTMHTLDEIFTAVTAIGAGTRIPISALPFAIGAPGSYVVTADLVSVGLPGITVTASDVTIDLDGHDLAGAMAGPGEDCIVLTPGFDNVKVHNGSIHDWGGDGVDLGPGAGHRVSDLTVESCGENGIVLGPDSQVSRCVVRLNAGDGVVSFGGSHIENLIATANGFPGPVGPGGGDGIFLGGINDTLIGCVLSANFDDGVGIVPGGASHNTANNCIAEGNGFGSLVGAGFNGLSRLTDCSANFNAADGFFVAVDGGVVVNCVANDNGLNGFNVEFTNVSDCKASANALNGILALQCRIRDCNVTGNFDDGIEGTTGNFISGNNVNGNAVNGIVLTGAANTIENNHCTFNGAFGIDTGTLAPGLANAVFANRATGAFGGPGPDYFLDPGNTAAPIVGPGPVGAGYGLNIVY